MPDYGKSVEISAPLRIKNDYSSPNAQLTPNTFRQYLSTKSCGEQCTCNTIWPGILHVGARQQSSILPKAANIKKTASDIRLHDYQQGSRINWCNTASAV
jgi:hypothetical protein